jgi:hypothetical protein
VSKAKGPDRDRLTHGCVLRNDKILRASFKDSIRVKKRESRYLGASHVEPPRNIKEFNFAGLFCVRGSWQEDDMHWGRRLQRQ